MPKSYPDFLVIGGGVIGLSVARELKRRERGARVVVIEKERACGMHASGRNSGVLHAGFYYSPGSLKARFTRSGNALMTQYCIERGLPINRCGKLVVGERSGLQALFDRGVANGVTLELIDAKQANDIEPRAIVQERALWSPTTSTISPRAVMDALVRDATSEGIEIKVDTEFNAPAGFVVNSAGLGALAIAQQFGFASHYELCPVEGLYLLSDEPPGALRTNLYPVPDPAFPYLGVHFTVAVDGSILIGPTDGPVPREAIIERAATLARGVRIADYTRWGNSGVRAQLYDTRKHALEMDFVIEHDERSLHILNAVSPGFTCAMSFAEYVVDAALTRPSSTETHPR